MSTAAHATGDPRRSRRRVRHPRPRRDPEHPPGGPLPCAPMFPGAHAATTPDKPAVIIGETGQVVTYRQLDAEANRVSHVFRSLGLQPGDHVAFCLENHPATSRSCGAPTTPGSTTRR